MIEDESSSIPLKDVSYSSSPKKNDIEKLKKQLSKKLPTFQCLSCEGHHLKCFLHIETGQCPQCFYKDNLHEV